MPKPADLSVSEPQRRHVLTRGSPEPAVARAERLEKRPLLWCLTRQQMLPSCRIYGASRTRTGDLLGAIQAWPRNGRSQRGWFEPLAAQAERRIPPVSPALLTKESPSVLLRRLRGRRFRPIPR